MLAAFQACCSGNLHSSFKALGLPKRLVRRTVEQGNVLRVWTYREKSPKAGIFYKCWGLLNLNFRIFIALDKSWLMPGRETHTFLEVQDVRERQLTNSLCLPWLWITLQCIYCHRSYSRMCLVLPWWHLLLAGIAFVWLHPIYMCKVVWLLLLEQEELLDERSGRQYNAGS